jgi:hypothetical protein
VTAIGIKHYCACGVAMTGRTSSLKAAVDLDMLWAEHHTGDGHAPATREQAAAARRRSERKRHQED